jgi:hypothetical protein
MRNKGISPIGDDWNTLRETLLTPEERAETDIKIALLGDQIQYPLLNPIHDIRFSRQFC